MMGDIIDAYNNSQIALIEAGTGTGKSLAYLIPALLWYKGKGERTVISTNTINLQEQLLFKDIPLITKALNMECKAVLIKGMSNYLCLRKLSDVKQELPLLSEQEAHELNQIERWKETTSDGSRSTLPLVPSFSTWEKVGAEYDTCTGKDCPFYKDCYYVKARKSAQEANILIVNHHLLCSDLVARDKAPTSQEGGIIPPYTRVILDEAHNFEEIATDFFADELNQLSLLRTISRLSSERGGKATGKLQQLKLQILEFAGKLDKAKCADLAHRLSIDLPAARWDLFHHIDAFCLSLRRLAASLNMDNRTEDGGKNEIKLRLLPPIATHPIWEKEVLKEAEKVIHSADKFILGLESLSKDIDYLKNEKLDGACKALLFDIKAMTNRLIEDIAVLKRVMDTASLKDRVRWIEIQMKNGISTNTVLRDADLDVSKALAINFFDKFGTIILVSATLTTNNHFKFIRQRLGIIPDLIKSCQIKEYVYDSPFNYKKQALFAIPTDLPSPTEPGFVKAAAKEILKTLKTSYGNAFVLFTSYTMLKECYELLYSSLTELKFNPMKQGDTNRQTLLKKFKETNGSVLFGTDSFWEGVDVAGEALRCVILVKLPFRVPTEPILQARAEAITAAGGDPFMEYFLPGAIVKFKQGFGRLIRNKKDRGCILCLDGRLLTKGYGKQFLESLPPCEQIFAESKEIQVHMKEFYKRTYALTK